MTPLVRERAAAAAAAAAARCGTSTRWTHDRLLLVATDRVSAFDVVMREAIPFKGAVLTQLTRVVVRQLARHRRHITC